jgi:hypothetical protein
MNYDVAIVGGGISGFHAAIAASRCGLKTLLIEKNSTIGGLTTLGLVNPFMKYWLDEEVLVKGIFYELTERLKKNYGIFYNTVDSELMKIEMMKMIKESKVELLLRTMVIDVESTKDKINSLQVQSSNGEKFNIESDFFVDASGDGIVGYLSGNECLVGDMKGNNQALTIMFTIGGVDFTEVVEDVRSDPNNFFAWVSPNMEVISVAGYFKEIEEAKKEGHNLPIDHFFYVQLPGDNRVTVNTMNISKNAIDNLKLSRSVVDGTIMVDQIFNFAKKYVKGFENSYLEKIAPEIGIRESRRIKGLYIFTGEDVRNYRKFPDGVVKGCYGIDIHSETKKINEEEKIFIPQYDNYYEIPLRSLISQKFSNLAIVGRCFSSDFEGQSAARIQPTCAGMGQAIGTAIYLAMENNCPLSIISREDIESQLSKITIV